ncbi:hypothetical protein JCM8097_001554 [Rhodosporidiobolus ruineniae]
MLLPALRTASPRAVRIAIPLLPRHTIYRMQSTQAGSTGDYTSILLSSPAPGVSLITLNRPKALNALNSTLFHELNAALRTLSVDDSVGAVVLTGSDKAFAAGADIKEMKDKQFAEVYKGDFLAHWTELSSFRKPIVAAVSGYAVSRMLPSPMPVLFDILSEWIDSRGGTDAFGGLIQLGGGCELAMMCDIILASPTAVFGQPEINLGVIPGAGGTQRLTHAIGKSRAMELVLTGRNFSAQEASDWGLVSRVVDVEKGSVVDEAVKVAKTIAGKGQLAVQAAKEGVNSAYELSLAQGLHLERRLFHQLFATNDQKEGMSAFAAKKKPEWTNS